MSTNRSIKEIDLSANVALDTLECMLYNLTKLDVSKNVRLRSVNLQSASIISLDLSMLPELKALDVRFSGISEIKLKNPALLEELAMTGAKVSFSDPRIFSKLHTLHFGSGQFSTNLSSLPDLRVLNLYDVKATAIDLSGNKNLETLVLYECGFNELNLTNNTRLKQLSLHTLPNLKALDLRSASDLTFFGSILNNALKTICVSKIPDPSGMGWKQRRVVDLCVVQVRW